MSKFYMALFSIFFFNIDLPIKLRHSLILAHPLPWPLGEGPAYMASWASSFLRIIFLPPPPDLWQPGPAGSSWRLLVLYSRSSRSMAGRQAQGGSCTAAVRLVAEAVVYTSSPLHHPPVKSDPALAARGYKTHNCRKAQVAQTKAVSPLKT